MPSLMAPYAKAALLRSAKRLSGQMLWVWLLRFIGSFDAVFHAVTWSFDDDGFAVMHDSVEDSGCHDGVVGEGFCPVFIGTVGGDDGRVFFVAVAEDLKKEFGADAVDWEVA